MRTGLQRNAIKMLHTSRRVGHGPDLNQVLFLDASHSGLRVPHGRLDFRQLVHDHVCLLADV